MAEGPRTPVIKGNKQYGDQKALDSLVRAGSGLKQGNADTLPMERRPVGRPTGSTAPQAQPLTNAVPQEHIVLMEDFSRASLIAQVASAAAQDMMAGPWLRKYAEIAQENVRRAGEKLRTGTPFFE